VRRIAGGVTVLAVHEPSAHNDEKEPDYKTKRHKDPHTSDVAPTPFCIPLQHSLCPLRLGENDRPQCEFQGQTFVDGKGLSLPFANGKARIIALARHPSV
jgi:hypothetical protein